MRRLLLLAVVGALGLGGPGTGLADVTITTFKVTDGAHPHDVAPGRDGVVWYTAQHQGALGRLDPKTGAWRARKLPGDDPRAYAVYVDDQDKVWLSDFSANAMVRFDPVTQKFDVFKGPRRGVAVRQIHGRPGEVWAPESGTDTIVRYVYKAR